MPTRYSYWNTIFLPFDGDDLNDYVTDECKCRTVVIIHMYSLCAKYGKTTYYLYFYKYLQSKANTHKQVPCICGLTVVLSNALSIACGELTQFPISLDIQFTQSFQSVHHIASQRTSRTQNHHVIIVCCVVSDLGR